MSPTVRGMPALDEADEEPDWFPQALMAVPRVRARSTRRNLVSLL